MRFAIALLIIVDIANVICNEQKALTGFDIDIANVTRNQRNASNRFFPQTFKLRHSSIQCQGLQHCFDALTGFRLKFIIMIIKAT